MLWYSQNCGLTPAMFVTEADMGRADKVTQGSQAGLDRARLLDRTLGQPQRLPTLKYRVSFLCLLHDTGGGIPKV